MAFYHDLIENNRGRLLNAGAQTSDGTRGDL